MTENWCYIKNESTNVCHYDEYFLRLVQFDSRHQQSILQHGSERVSKIQLQRSLEEHLRTLVGRDTHTGHF